MGPRSTFTASAHGISFENREQQIMIYLPLSCTGVYYGQDLHVIMIIVTSIDIWHRKCFKEFYWVVIVTVVMVVRIVSLHN